MTTHAELKSLAILVASRAADMVRHDLTLEGVKRVTAGWQITLRAPRFYLVIEILATSGTLAEVEAFVRSASVLAVLSGPGSRRFRIYRERMNPDEGSKTIDAFLAHVRGRLHGDPRSEALLAA